MDLDTISPEQRSPEGIINCQTVESTKVGIPIILLVHGSPRRRVKMALVSLQQAFQLQHLIRATLPAQEHMCLTSG